MIDEQITLHSYNLAWPQLCHQEIETIYLGIPLKQIHLQHIGSTAVVGLIAKPIIDIMIGLESWSFLNCISEVLLKLGYENLGESGVSGRYYFRKRSDPAFNVHVLLWQGKLWNDNILFRDYLSSHPEEMSTYCVFRSN